MGEVLVKQNKFDKAEPRLIRAVRVARASGDTISAIFANLQLARIRIEQGDHANAEALLRESHREARSLNMKEDAYEAAILLADLKARTGEAEEALKLLDQAVKESDKGASIYGPAADRVRALALASTGRASEAVGIAEAALETARARNFHYEVAMLLLCKADLLETDDPDTTAQLRSEGQSIIERLDIRPPEVA